MTGTNTYNKTIQKLLVLVILFTSTIVVGQDECPEPLGSTVLEVNNVRALVTNRQLSWYDGVDALYEVPAGSGINSFFASNFWIAGRTPDNQLKIAAGTYEQDGSRFSPGPLATGPGVLDPGICEDYNRLFIVTREMSETHMQYFQSIEDGTVEEDFPNGYQLPQVLLDYPGTIITSAGIEPHGAPYYDSNQNGSYDPLGGDFPLFSNMEDVGACEACETLGGDISIFWIDNDNSPTAQISDLEPIGIEIHNQVYAFETDGDIGNTIFHQKKIINKGSQTLSQTYIGLWADPDLGCPQDDYIGCDVQRNLGVVYNSDNMDQNCIQIGYGENPPSAGVLVFQGPYKDPDGGPIQTLSMSGFMALSSSMPFPSGNPQNAEQYYNLLNSKWLDGSPLTYGAYGMGGDIEAKYAYPHDTDPLGTGTNQIPVDPWSEASVDADQGDRRFVMNFGPFTMDPGEVNCISYATIFAPNNGSENPLSAIQEVADNIKESYDDCFQDIVLGIDDAPLEDFVFIDWDMQDLKLNLQSILNQETTVSVFDIQGKLLLRDTFQTESSFNLAGHPSGLYVVKLINENGDVQTERILISK